MDTRQVGVADALGAKPLLALVARLLGADRADVAGRRRERGFSAGTSNFGSWVRMQIAVRASTGERSRKRSGHSITSSSASGKRSSVTKGARASQTVTR